MMLIPRLTSLAWQAAFALVLSAIGSMPVSAQTSGRLRVSAIGGVLMPLNEVGSVRGVSARWESEPLLGVAVERDLRSGPALRLRLLATLGSQLRVKGANAGGEDVDRLIGGDATIAGFLAGVKVAVMRGAADLLFLVPEAGVMHYGGTFELGCDLTDPVCSARTAFARSATAPVLGAGVGYSRSGERWAFTVELGNTLGFYPVDIEVEESRTRQHSFLGVIGFSWAMR